MGKDIQSLRKIRVCYFETRLFLTARQLRLFNIWDRPRIRILRRVVLPRPPDATNKKPIIGYLFFDGSEVELSQATSLILDLPGGGFICMSPRNHEERLRRWAIRCKRPILSIDYRKAPECKCFEKPFFLF